MNSPAPYPLSPIRAAAICMVAGLTAYCLFNAIEWAALGHMSTCGNGPDGWNESRTGDRYFIFLPPLLLSLRYLLQAKCPKSSFYLKAVLFLLSMFVLTGIPWVFHIAPHLVTDLFGLSILFGDIPVAITVLCMLLILFRGVYPAARTLNERSAKTASRTWSCLAALIASVGHILLFSTCLLIRDYSAALYAYSRKERLCSFSHLIYEPSCFSFSCAKDPIR